jgi:RNA polymerase sigma factor (sigma-70 family)
MIGPLFPELLAAAQSGDEQAFAVLWRDLQPVVLRYFRVVARDAADDLAADTWVSVIRRLGRFRGDERAFRAWLFTVARHRAIDWCRQAARRPTNLVPVEQLAEHQAPDDPLAQVLESQSTRAALALLAELPPGRCCICCERAPSGQTVVMTTHRPRPATIPRSAFAGFCFPPEVIVLAVRWYLRFGLSYRDVEELLVERDIEVDHVTIYRWVLRFTPLLAEAARPCRHAVGNRWQVDETYVKVAGQWRYVYRAIDQFGQVIDVFVSRGATRQRPAGSSNAPSA